MARKTANITIDDEGRDKGKVFLITEMSASQAERWAMRTLLALMKGGVELPEGFEHLGMAGIAEVGIRALSGLDFEVAEPLLDEMMKCVRAIPDSAKLHYSRDLVDTDTEEVLTRIRLRAEVWKLHTDFLKAVAPSTSGAQAAAIQ